MSERYDSATVGSEVRGTWISAEEAQKAWASGDHGGRFLPKTHTVMVEAEKEVRFSWDEDESRVGAIVKAFRPEQETVRIDRAVLARELASPRREVEKDLDARVPGHVPSSMAQRSIAKAGKKAPAPRSLAKVALVGFLAALALAAVLAMSGCSSAQLATAENDIHAAATAARAAIDAVNANAGSIDDAEAKIALLATQTGNTHAAVMQAQAAWAAYKANQGSITAFYQALEVVQAATATKTAGQ